MIPYNIQSQISNILFSTNVPKVLTSATLSTEENSGDIIDDFSYFADDCIGVPWRYEVIKKESPYDYNKQAIVYFEKEIQYVSSNNNPQEYKEYLENKTNRIYEIIRIFKGKTLLLFTSYIRMEEVYNMIIVKLK